MRLWPWRCPHCNRAILWWWARCRPCSHHLWMHYSGIPRIEAQDDIDTPPYICSKCEFKYWGMRMPHCMRCGADMSPDNKATGEVLERG